MENILDFSLDVEPSNEGDQTGESSKRISAKYKKYTLEKKASVLAMLDQNNNNTSEVERLTGIDRRTIGSWATHRFAIETANNRRDRSRLMGAGRKAKFGALEPRVLFRA